MTLLVVNDPTISIGITDDNRPLALTVDSDINLSLTISNETIPVVDYGTGGSSVGVYEKKDVGTSMTGSTGDAGRVWTLANAKPLVSYFIARNGAIIHENDYTITTGVNATVTFTSINIFDEDILLFIGFT